MGLRRSEQVRLSFHVNLTSRVVLIGTVFHSRMIQFSTDELRDFCFLNYCDILFDG